MARPGNSFARKKPKYEPRPTVLIITEDAVSSREYLQDLARHLRVITSVEVSHCGRTDPLGIVQSAKSRCAKFDRVFCVFDRDSHPTFNQAIQEAALNPKLTVIDSHPCFEYWILLHFRYHRASYVRERERSAGACVIRDLLAIPEMSQYSKGVGADLFRKTYERLATAVTHSEQALRDAHETGEPNPSTKVHKLYQELKRMSET